MDNVIYTPKNPEVTKDNINTIVLEVLMETLEETIDDKVIQEIIRIVKLKIDERIKRAKQL